MKQYLIIGNGAAGTTAAEAIRQTDEEGKIVLLTKEELPFYSRMRLPEYVAGRISENDLIIRKPDWYKERAIDLRLGATVSRVDFQVKQAFTDTNEAIPYDSLLLACGSNSFIPPVEGSGKENVFSLRSVADAGKLADLPADMERVVVIGGGLLGLEAGAALLARAKKVTVVEFFDRLLPRQLDAQGANLLQGVMETMGFGFRLGQATEEITGEGAVAGVRLKSGELLEADAVVFAAGVRSDLGLVRDAAIETDRGIVVDDRMETSLPGVFAAGDVAQYDGINFCIWPEAVEQGRVAGINMAGGEARYTTIAPSNRLKVAGIAVASAGEIDADNKFLSDTSIQGDVYRKIVTNDQGRTIGCIMIGDLKEFNSIVKAIKGE
ncbi:MAG: NAD(P)/FAD-dependent oxidoreductase [Desulfobacteraceae bacterium]|nr:NAD(P)/FAD-dependent oxidoreductase [Desulfobacteraceae bacterium]